MPDSPITNFKDSTLPVGVDLGKKLVTKDYLLEVYGSILENSPASGLVVTPELWTWGNNNAGQLGINRGEYKNTPVTTFAGGTTWKQVSGGGYFSSAIKTDGTLWTWGSDSEGELGTNDTTNRSIPVTTSAGGNDWKQVSSGFRHTAAIKNDGSLWTWGRGAEGQLGNNNNTQRNTPVTTFAGQNTWKQVSCGDFFTTAIKTDGSLWVWGRNNDGQLGIFSNTNRSTPVTTFAGGTDWKQVAGGQENTVAIKTNGTLWIWGTNNGGRMGINDANDFNGKNTPVTTFAGGTTWKQVDCGQFTTAIKTDGTLWTWGRNDYGQLGINVSTGVRRTPVTTFVGGTNWKQSSCMFFHMAAIKTDGSLWTCGRNGDGQLGTNDNTQRNTPTTTFAGGNNWKRVDCGGWYTEAIQTIDYI